MTTRLRATFQTPVGVKPPTVLFARAMFTSVVANGLDFEIFGTVIHLIFIDVMNNLSFFQRASKLLGRYQSVHGDVPIGSRVWVVWRFHKQVSVSNGAAPPVRAVFAPWLFRRDLGPFLKKAFLRAEDVLSNVTGFAMNRFAAIKALGFGWRFGAFPGAKDRLPNFQAVRVAVNQGSTSLAGVHIFHRRIIHPGALAS